MININELRIGNYIQDGKVEQINNSIDEVYYSGDGYYQSDYCCNLNPLPLTEEWLLKFGFKEVISNSWYSKLAKNKNTINISLSGLVAINEEKPIRAIEHVHQLQNLYFALTNEEL